MIEVVNRETVTPHIAFLEARLTEDLIDAAMPLIELHWEEIAHHKDIPLKIDKALYVKAGAENMARAYLFMHDGEIQGYAVFFVRPNIHYSTSLQAVQDVLWLAPIFRGQMYGARFLQWCDEQLLEDGVQVVYHHVKLAHDFGATLKRLGYEPVETIWSRRLDG